jgi:hypothetical protein
VIPYGQALIDLIEEIATEYTLEQRRAFIASIEREYGKDEANRLKQSLKDFWAGKGK